MVKIKQGKLTFIIGVVLYMLLIGCGDTPLPSAPTRVSANAGDGQITISWSSVSDATSYNIYWSTISGVTKTNGTKITDAISPYTHTDRTNGTTYYYVITTVNSSKESSESNQVSAIPQQIKQAPSITLSASPTSGPAPLTITFTITASDPDGTILKIEGDFDGDGSFETDVYEKTSYSYIYNNKGTYNVTVRAIDNDNLTTISNLQSILISMEPGEIVKTISFPSLITWVSDIVFDSNSNTLWLLCPYNQYQSAPLKLIQISTQTGDTLQTITLNDPPFFINQSSEITFDGQYFWMTSYGFSNGVPQSFIYKVNQAGEIVNNIPCPASSIGGFCEGITWDGSYLWSGGSDNKNIVKFTQEGVVQATYTFWDTIGISDISYRSDNGQLIITKNNRIFQVDILNNGIINELSTGYTKEGDWDGQLFWFINNSAQQLEGTYIW